MIWERLEPHLPGRSGRWEGIARDNRLFIKAVFWNLRTGATWRDLSPDDGCWRHTHRRFIRWRHQRIWGKLVDILIDKPDYEWLMVDASHGKVHLHATGAKDGMPVKVVVTAGTTADCRQAGT